MGVDAPTAPPGGRSAETRTRSRSYSTNCGVPYSVGSAFSPLSITETSHVTAVPVAGDAHEPVVGDSVVNAVVTSSPPPLSKPQSASASPGHTKPSPTIVIETEAVDGAPRSEVPHPSRDGLEVRGNCVG